MFLDCRNLKQFLSILLFNVNVPAWSHFFLHTIPRAPLVDHASLARLDIERIDKSFNELGEREEL